MTKGKFGIYLWFYAVLAFILVFLGQTLLCGLLLGFAIAAERNEWLSRQVIQAFSLSLAVSLITGILDFVQRALYGLLSEITYVGSGFNTVFDVLDGIISILVLVLVIIAIIKVAKEQDSRIVVSGDYVVMVIAGVDGPDYSEIDSAIESALA